MDLWTKFCIFRMYNSKAIKNTCLPCLSIVRSKELFVRGKRGKNKENKANCSCPLVSDSALFVVFVLRVFVCVLGVLVCVCVCT